MQFICKYKFYNDLIVKNIDFLKMIQFYKKMIENEIYFSKNDFYGLKNQDV